MEFMESRSHFSRTFIVFSNEENQKPEQNKKKTNKKKLLQTIHQVLTKSLTFLALDGSKKIAWTKNN